MADAFLSSIEKDLLDPPSRSSHRSDRDRSHRDRDRDYDHGDRSSRRSSRRHGDSPEADQYRSSRRRDDPDAGRRRRDYREESPRMNTSSNRRRRDEEDDYYSRRDDDAYRSSRSRGGYRDDPYSSRRGYGGGSDPYEMDRGSRGGWREPAREPSSPRRRSPTPEGTIPISQRKRKGSQWDLRPEGFEDVSALQAKATGLFGVPGQSRTLGVPPSIIGRDSTGQAVIPEALPPLRFGGDLPASNGQSADSSQVGSGMNSANRQSRRLYIGNVGGGTSESNFMAFWNDKMKEMKFNLAEGDPCISVQVNGDKGYGFVEFRCPEECTSAMSFDGVIFHGQALKIRRPKDYVGTDVTPRPLHVPGVISTNVPDGPNKIYVGGLPTYLNEDQIIELLKAFGEVRAFNLVREANSGPSKGFAFCEYVDPNLTDLACQGLNDMELGDRKLIVQRASAGQRGLQAPGGGPSGATGSNNAPLGTRSNGPNSFALPSNGEAGEPTKCMTMLNMVTPQELIDDEEYAEIVEDIKEECDKYGSVLDVRIPRPLAQSKGSSAQAWKSTVDASGPSEATHDEHGTLKEREGVGRVYVRFAEVDQCESALKAIAGRQFGGRLVICAYLTEDDWPTEEDGKAM